MMTTRRRFGEFSTSGFKPLRQRDRALAACITNVALVMLWSRVIRTIIAAASSFTQLTLFDALKPLHDLTGRLREAARRAFGELARSFVSQMRRRRLGGLSERRGSQTSRRALFCLHAARRRRRLFVAAIGAMFDAHQSASAVRASRHLRRTSSADIRRRFIRWKKKQVNMCCFGDNQSTSGRRLRRVLI